MTKEQVLQDIDYIEDIILNKDVNTYKKEILARGMILDIEKSYIMITHDIFFATYDIINRRITFKPMPTSEIMADILSNIEWTKGQLIEYISNIDQDLIDALSLS